MKCREKATLAGSLSIAFSFWLATTGVCLGSGRDSALQKHFMKVFRNASDAALLEADGSSSGSARLVEMHNGNAVLGYGVEVEVVSRSGPFFIMVAVSAEEQVLDVQIPRYPHKKGRGVRKRAFLQQFEGVPYGKPLVLGEQVDAVSGATSSSTAVTDGVREALRLVHRQRKAEA